MVADDHVNTELCRLIDHLHLLGPAVKRDEERAASLPRKVQPLIRDATPLRVAIRDVELQQRRDLPQVLIDEGDSCRAIDVVVSVDKDPLLIADGLIDPLDGGIHILHQEGVMQLAHPWLQEV